MPSAVPTIPDILESASSVVRRAKHVLIDPEAVRRWAGWFAAQPFEQPDEDPDLLFRGPPDQGANYVLLIDALNFCFWSDVPWEIVYQGRTWTRTLAMMAGVRRSVENDASWLTADRWAAATRADVNEMFAGRGSIPLPDRRVDILVETGTILRDRFGGQFEEVVNLAQRRANRLAYLLSDCFPSFRDVAVYDGKPVAFLKRAQICAADLHRVWAANGHQGLRDLDRLTVFADYRLPQLFRHEGMLHLARNLGERVDRGDIIEAGSQEEIEIRAATVVVGQLLCDELRALGRTVAPWKLDYDLWLRARSPKVTVPHHRAITHFY